MPDFQKLRRKSLLGAKVVPQGLKRLCENGMHWTPGDEKYRGLSTTAAKKRRLRSRCVCLGGAGENSHSTTTRLKDVCFQSIVRQTKRAAPAWADTACRSVTPKRVQAARCEALAPEVTSAVVLILSERSERSLSASFSSVRIDSRTSASTSRPRSSAQLRRVP